MRRGGEEPLWDRRVPAYLAAAFLCKLAGDLPVAFLGHHPPGAWTNPVARSLGEDRPALSAGPPLGRTTTRAQSGTPGPGCAGLLVDQGRMVTLGVSPFSERAPGLYFAAGVPAGQSSVCWALELALGRGA